MRITGLIALAFLTTITVSAVAHAQTTASASAPENIPAAARPPWEIVSHKIGQDYYPMLDRPGLTTPAMTADLDELPPTPSERLARQSTRNNKNTAAPIAPGDKSRGRLVSHLRVLDDAQWVQLVIKNTESKPIKSVEWDFAFPRYENGQLLPRFDVSTAVEIKPGGKKTLKHQLPAGAKKCEVVRVVRDEKQTENVSTFEAVCGRGFYDPLLEGQKQETISIKRIAYADGTVWTSQQ